GRRRLGQRLQVRLSARAGPRQHRPIIPGGSNTAHRMELSRSRRLGIPRVRAKMGRLPDVRAMAYAYRGRMSATALMITPPAWSDTLVLVDGTRIGFRAVDRDDRDGLALLFARMSAQSRYRRYLSPKPELSPRELAFLTDVD